MKNKVFNAKLVLLVSTLAATVTVCQAQSKPKSTVRYSTGESRSGTGITWLNVESDSINDPRKLITLYKNNEVYKIQTNGGKITELYIDEKKIAEADFPQYQSMVTDLLEKIRKDQEQAERDRKLAEKDRARAEQDRARAEVMREQAEVDRRKAEKDREQATRDRERAEVDRTEAAKHRDEAAAHQRDAEKQRAEAEVHRKEAEEHRAQAMKDREQAEKHRQQAEHDRHQAEKDRARAEVDRQHAEVDRKHAEEDRKMMEQMINDLVSEKVIGSREDLRVVQLSEEALIINDRKQPDALHQKMKAKYLKKKGGRLTYMHSSDRTFFDVDNK